MHNFRPAGYSDEETDSDEEYAFLDRPSRNFGVVQPNKKRQIENNLQTAIINNDIEELERIIAGDLNKAVNTNLDSGWTPLLHACFHAQDNIVRYLLEAGADPNQHADSVTPIMTVCSNTSANEETVCNIVTELIKHKCGVDVGDKYGQTPLMRAIGSGRVSIVQKLLEVNVDIERRDHQGWTAFFWAAHHNQKEILEILIANGARTSEVDLNGRTALSIAETHAFQDIVDVIKSHLNIEEEEIEQYEMEIVNWASYYPGLDRGGRPDYRHEIPHLLYGMNCDKLQGVIMSSGMGLRTFLLLEDNDMEKLGIDMPFERKRLKVGLYNFHKRGWKLNAVSGLYAQKAYKDITVVESLTSLGTHLQQVYIIEATLQYSLREYSTMQNQIKFEPPDSPVLDKLQTATKKMLTNINNIRREMRILKSLLNKIARNNREPADLIKERSFYDKAKGHLTEVVIAVSLGLLIKNAVKNFLKK